MVGLVTLDFGNSNPHAGLFQRKDKKWELLKVVPLSNLDSDLFNLKMDPNNTSMVVCEVKSREDEIAKLQEKGYFINRVKDYWRGAKFAGMPVNYSNSLGEDRLIEAYFTYKKEQQNSLIINAGTFVTMDIVTTDGFQGGYIIPSFENYAKIYQQGEKLKSFSFEGNLLTDLPHDTKSAMRDSYSAFGCLAKKLHNNFEIKKIILTGGSNKVWEEMLKIQGFGEIVENAPHLIHWALHHWMITQIELQ